MKGIKRQNPQEARVEKARVGKGKEGEEII